MLIQNNKYAVMRNNRTEILCGMKGCFQFCSVTDLKNKTIKTYKTPYIDFPYILHGDKSTYEVVPVVVTVQIPNDVIVKDAHLGDGQEIPVFETPEETDAIIGKEE